MIKYSFFRNVFCRQLNLLRTQTYEKSFNRHCSVRRALLHVPGSDAPQLNKALQLKLDCIIMDCEDGVALDMKDEARKNIKEFLDKGPVTHQDPEWSVRVNPIQTPELFNKDINAILSAKHLPASICLPKFSEKVWENLMRRPEDDRGPIKLIMFIESAIAMIRLPEICKKAEDLATMAPIIPVALVLGSDLSANLGATRTQSSIELLYARQKLVLVAKAFGLQAIDIIFSSIHDDKGFTRSCEDGMILGFTGKQVIHPDQVMIAQEQFVPSRTKVNWAKRVVRHFKENQEKEQGAFNLDNMIDMPAVRQAENILDVARAAGKLD